LIALTPTIFSPYVFGVLPPSTPVVRISEAAGLILTIRGGHIKVVSSAFIAASRFSGDTASA
jgi:hypothetical protein